MVNCASELLQLYCEPDTVMVAVISDVVLLMAVKAGRLPVPLAARPMDGLLFVQLYTVPATGPAIVTAVVAAPVVEETAVVEEPKAEATEEKTEE